MKIVKARIDSRQTQNIKVSLVRACVRVCVCLCVVFVYAYLYVGWVIALVESRGKEVIFLHV